MADFKVPGDHIYKGMRLSRIYSPDVLDRVPDFKFRPNDVLIPSYPKSGSSWLEEVVWLITNDMDIETSKQENITIRLPMLEIKRGGLPPNIDTLPDEKSPRVLKTHLPYSFYKQSIEGEEHPQFKTVVGMRNVRDVLVAYYNFYRKNPQIKFDQDFKTFFQLFKEKKLLLGDYFEHVLSWWQGKDNPHIHFVKYEDLNTDPKEEIRKLAVFLGKTLSESQIDAFVNESSFASKILSNGEVGDWHNNLTAEQLDYINSRCEKELAPHGLHFQYTVGSVEQEHT